MTANSSEALYRLQKRDVRRISMVLVDAFRDDPVWKKVFVEAGFEQKQSVFEVPIRHSLR